MVFQYLHGIAWSDVANQPTFRELWPQLEAFMQGAEFLVAHNASFDRGVLNACCELYGVSAPKIPFLCTVKLARQVWDIRPTKLPDVCSHLSIRLNHHNAASDSLACAQIVMRAANSGADLAPAFLGQRRRSRVHNLHRKSPRAFTPAGPAIVRLTPLPSSSREEISVKVGAEEKPFASFCLVALGILALFWLLSSFF